MGFNEKYRKNAENTAVSIAKEIANSGGRAYYVGGCVRDSLLGIQRDYLDFDIEIHGLYPEKIEEILSRFGKAESSGKAFGIYGIKGLPFDFAVPRSDMQKGSGHRDLEISFMPFASIESAALRRDFTVNAVYKDVLTGEIFDPCGGINDIKKKTLRCVDESKFALDPLRILRACAYASVLGFDISSETQTLCKNADISSLSPYRVFSECTKALLYSIRPSVFFEHLKNFNLLDEFFPEAKKLIGTPQSKKHHAEGDVWTHTMMVINEAAKLKEEAVFKKGFMFSALTHDFGKPFTTRMISGELHAYGHERAGIKHAEAFMSRLTSDSKLIEYVKNMTEYHMKPRVAAAEKISVPATDRLFNASVCPEDLILLAQADNYGKIPIEDFSIYRKFLDERLEIFRDIEKHPRLTGADLQKAGFKPGRDFKIIKAYADKCALSGLSVKETLKLIESRFKK